MFSYSILEKKSALCFLIWYCAFINFWRFKIFFSIFLERKSQLLSNNVIRPKIGMQYLTFYPVRSLTFWRIFCPVQLFHHVRLLIFGEFPPQCDFMLFVYLIVKSTPKIQSFLLKWKNWIFSVLTGSFILSYIFRRFFSLVTFS